MTYEGLNGEEYTLAGDPKNAFFVNRYAKVSPYEDRAELMEAVALIGEDGIKSPQLKGKIKYYREAISYYLAAGEFR